MKLLVLTLCCLAVGAIGAEWETYEPVELYYHERIGIPRAEALRQAELAADFDGTRIISGSPAALGAYPYMVSYNLKCWIQRDTKIIEEA